MQQYKRLEGLLWEELGVEPLLETTDLLARISTATEKTPFTAAAKQPAVYRA